MWRCSTGFNGATAFQPWKQSLGTRRTNTRSRFNGATAFQPWKHEGLCDEKGLPTDASMGPRPFSRGNAIFPHFPGLPGSGLQWGHGLSAVETASKASG